MLKVKVTSEGVVIKAERIESLYTDPRKIQDLITVLEEAKVQLVESIARKAEESVHSLWENV